MSLFDIYTRPKTIKYFAHCIVIVLFFKGGHIITKEINERDFKPLIRNVKAATSAVLERLDIDTID
jgi:hypothetical protein